MTELDETDLRAALQAVGHFCRTAPTVHQSMWRLRARLEQGLLLMSAGGHERHSGASQLSDVEWIGTNIAAQTLGWGERRLRRHRDVLGGRYFGRHLFFDASVVQQYAESLEREER